MFTSLTNEQIRTSITRHIDKTNAIYTDDLIKDTGLTRESITRYLKKNGFVKTGGNTSKRWQLSAEALV